eukprot:6220000-Pyramimonas_sp.AAC.1
MPSLATVGFGVWPSLMINHMMKRRSRCAKWIRHWRSSWMDPAALDRPRKASNVVCPVTKQ